MSAKPSLRRRFNSFDDEFKENKFSQTLETFYSSDFDESSSSNSESKHSEVCNKNKLCCTKIRSNNILTRFC